MMNQPQTNHSDFENSELLLYIRFLRKWWWLLLLSCIVCGAVGYTIADYAPRIYQASTTLIVGRPIQDTDVLSREEVDSRDSLAQNYAALAVRQPVLEATVAALDLNVNWRELQNKISIQIPESTQLLEITAEGASPAEAERIANEVALRLIQLSPSAAGNVPQNDAQFVEERLQILRAKIETGQEKLIELENTFSNNIQGLGNRQLEIDELEQLLTQWDQIYSGLLQARNQDRTLNQLHVFAAAEAEPNPVWPNKIMLATFAGLLGLLATTGILILHRLTDGALRSNHDVERRAGLHVLGSVGLRGANKLREDYLIVGGRIQFEIGSQNLKTLLVTSSTAEEGKSHVVENLAIDMARSGYRTVLINADWHTTNSHDAFQILPNNQGLADLLIKVNSSLKEYLRQTSHTNLWLLVSGRRLASSKRLLNSARMQAIIDEAEQIFDLVIINTEPALTSADATVLSRYADGAILVVQHEKTETNTVRQAVQTLQQAHVNLIGGVYNQPNFKRIKRGHFADLFTSRSIQEAASAKK
ncbi:MAG: polysaccharide biosynthesis tyrosine autokinase [Caldilineaceae bacterium]